jgi:pyruvate/2-oxoglutarate dehydrogenase complex dihydrolipoamide acyltransferase (E2) component
MPTHSVSLDRLLAAQPNHRLPLDSSLYVASEISRLVAMEHELNKGVGPAVQQISVTAEGGVVLAVGKLVYKLLTGKEPARDVVAPSHFNPGVDEELDAVVLSSLAPNPNRRPQSLRVLEAALSAVFEELELEPNPGALGKLAKAVPAAAPAAKPAPKPVAKAAAPAPKPVVMQAPQPAILKPAAPRYRPPVRFADDVEEESLSEAMSQPMEVPLWVHMQNFQSWLEPRRKVVGGITAAVVALLLIIAWPSSKKQVQADPDPEPAAEVVKPAPSKYQLVPESLLTTVEHPMKHTKVSFKRALARRK